MISNVISLNLQHHFSFLQHDLIFIEYISRSFKNNFWLVSLFCKVLLRSLLLTFWVLFHRRFEICYFSLFNIWVNDVELNVCIVYFNDLNINLNNMYINYIHKHKYIHDINIWIAYFLIYFLLLTKFLVNQIEFWLEITFSSFTTNIS